MDDEGRLAGKKGPARGTGKGSFPHAVHGGKVAFELGRVGEDGGAEGALKWGGRGEMGGEMGVQVDLGGERERANGAGEGGRRIYGGVDEIRVFF